MLQHKAQLYSWSVHRRLNYMADKKIPKLQRLASALSHYRPGVMKLNSRIKWWLSYFSQFLSAKINKSALHPPWVPNCFWYWSHTESSNILSVENNIYSWSSYLTGFSLSTHPFTDFYISQGSLALAFSSSLYAFRSLKYFFSDLYISNFSTYACFPPSHPRAPSELRFHTGQRLPVFTFWFLTDIILSNPLFLISTFPFQFNNFPGHTSPGPTVLYI